MMQSGNCAWRELPSALECECQSKSAMKAEQKRTDCRPGMREGEAIGKSGSRRALTTAAASMKRSNVQACGMPPPIASTTGARSECCAAKNCLNSTHAMLHEHRCKHIQLCAAVKPLWSSRQHYRSLTATLTRVLCIALRSDNPPPSSPMYTSSNVQRLVRRLLSGGSPEARAG